VVTREGFESVVDFAFSGSGFAAEAAKHAFPSQMFLPGSDLSAIEENIEKLVHGLVHWEPSKAQEPLVAPHPITVEGEDYHDAVDKLNALFLRNLWSDGLPIVPPTEKRVNWLLTGTEFPRDKIIGAILPRGGLATVSTVATAAAMAGCRPEYMPILIAAMQAILDPISYHQHMQATTGSPSPAVIVNGPIAKQVRLNSGYGCLGPNALYPAGASIGRAIRFLLVNVGGAIPGVGSMSIHGGPARYAGLVFAEDEEGLPSNWLPLNVERGFRQGADTVTVLPTSGSTMIWEGAPLNEREALFTLFDFAANMSVPYGAYYAAGFNPHGAPGIALIGRAAAQGFAKLGWSQDAIKTYLWEHSKLPDSPWLRKTLEHFSRRGLFVKDHIGYPMPIAVAPRNIMLVVAGGQQSGHSYWLRGHGGTYGPCTKEIVLPSNWIELLSKAEEELGPIAVL